jgi:hypothetical protein
LHIRKKAQEFVKPIVAARSVIIRSTIELLPFDSKYIPPRTPAVPKNKLIMASA